MSAYVVTGLQRRVVDGHIKRRRFVVDAETNQKAFSYACVFSLGYTQYGQMYDIDVHVVGIDGVRSFDEFSE